MRKETPAEFKPKGSEVTADSSSPSNVLSAGTLLQNRFEIVSLLGQGGMSTVYSAQDKVLGRKIALKVLQSSQHMDSNRFQRFQREARSTAKLDHPGIIKVFDYYFKEEPHCIAMELVEGITLADYISGTIEPDTTFILDTFISIADALGYAHKEGVVHRDIKPSNIMLVRGSVNPVKVMDFGIAKGLDDVTTKSNLTQTGEMIGSPLYMSPEQVTGKTADKRSDIYSFGCSLYESLTKTPPFLANSAVETMMKHLNENPLPLTTASLGKDYPDGLEEILVRLLQKNPDERYQSFEEVNEALREIRALPVPTQSTKTKDASDKEAGPGKKNVAIFLISAIVVCLLGLLLYSMYTEISVRSKDKFHPIMDFKSMQDMANAGLKATTDDGQLSKTPTRVVTADEVWKRTKHNDEGLNDQRLVQDLVKIEKSETNYNFPDYTLSDSGLQPLLGRPVQVLGLEGTNLAPKTLELLPHFKLLDLQLNDSSFDDPMSDVLESVKSLRRLEFGRTKVTDSALVNLDQLKLNRLVLEGDHIDNNGIKILSQEPMRETLTELNLSGTNIGDKVFPILQKFPNLEDLQLSHNSISPEVLTKATYPPHLTHLWAEMSTPLTLAEQKALKKRLPIGCRLVIHDTHID